MHATMKGTESSSENKPNEQPPPSKKVAKEQPPPMKRITRSSSRFKTKPMTEDEGSAIALSEDSRDKSSHSKEVTSGAVVSKLSTTALDALAAVAGAQVQTLEASNVLTQRTIPTKATTVAINPSPTEGNIFSTLLQVHQVTTIPNLSTMAQISTLRTFMDRAFAAMDELLGRRTTQTTTVTTILETPPTIPENPITKPTENPSVVAPIITETIAPTPVTTPLTTPSPTPMNTPMISPRQPKQPLKFPFQNPR
ncbi:hypothetical protein L6452_43716 [Arctium lappa]|uniref:Uncharacterized protein n=1 Tax=Arctium lappa TaxID=4217 RepID=A0ACB8XDN6_ARCLA|nr:hypothetical protein L6452_43716 [Arctium lappa]